MVFTNLKLPKLLYKATSKYNERIEVFQIGKNRRLSVNNIVQSANWNAPSVKNRIWGQLVSHVKEERPNAESILLFGLGGGTMVHLFAKEFPQCHITVVEIDSVMIDIAKKFFDLHKVKNLTVINADAMRVISEPEKFDLHKDTFDVVAIDIYCGSEYPQLGKSGTFLSGIKWFAKPGGFVVFNRIYIEKYQSEVDAFCDLVKNVFKDVKTVTVAGRTNSDNILIYGDVV